MKTEDLEMIAETTDLGSHQSDQHHHNQLKSITAVDSLISAALLIPLYKRSSSSRTRSK